MRLTKIALLATLPLLALQPAHARFLQIDPVGYKDQMNPYAYVGNDPMDGSDPTGRFVLGFTFGGEATVNATTGPNVSAGSASTGAYVSNQDTKGNGDVTVGSTITTGTSDGFRTDGGPGVYVLPFSGPSDMAGKGEVDNYDIGPLNFSVIKDANGNVIGVGISGSAPIPGASTQKTNTSVREQVSAKKTVQAVGTAVTKKANDAKAAAVNTVTNAVQKTVPSLPCTGKHPC